MAILLRRNGRTNLLNELEKGCSHDEKQPLFCIVTFIVEVYVHLKIRDPDSIENDQCRGHFPLGVFYP